MLPRHVLETPYKEGRLAQAWALGTPAQGFAGLGPFRFKDHQPGQQITLERNPFYWKTDRAGQHLPYLDRLVFLFVPSEDAQAVRFQSGEANVTTRLSATNFDVLLRDQGNRNYELIDRGPGLDYTFLFFNQNNLAEKGLAAIARKQTWFRQLAFREAVSLAIDREGIVRSSIEDGPRRSGVMSRQATSCGSISRCRNPPDRLRVRDSCCGRPASRGTPAARSSTKRVRLSNSPLSPALETRNGSRSRLSFRTI
jgi:ABC-type transport system substrate-binding protein